MGKWVIGFGLVTMLVVGGGLVFFQQSDDNATTKVPMKEEAKHSLASQPAPIVRHRVPTVEEPVEQQPETTPSVKPAPPPPKPLPILEESDEQLLSELIEFVDIKALKRFFQPKELINRFVVTTENLTTNSLPGKHLITRQTKGEFQVIDTQDGFFEIHPENFRRYDAFVSMIESIEPKRIVALYVRYYPLLQQAFDSLGYPDLYYNDRVIAMIDHLMETPDFDRSPRLVRPSVMYRFADPELEKLSSGQKVLLRMGPRNSKRLKHQLSKIREVLTGFGDSKN